MGSLFFLSPEEEEYYSAENDEKDTESKWQWLENQEKLYNLNSRKVNLVLAEIQERFTDKGERLKALSVLRLGTPYQLGCLGEESGRDKDPIFRLDVTDCTVFVLTNVALVHSQTVEEAVIMMSDLNYRPNSEITFENRLHFTTDRNEVSPYFKDVTQEVGGDKIKTKKVVLNKKNNGQRLIDIDWQREIMIRYIPSEYITRDFFEKLPESVGIAFLKKGDEEIGLDVRHEGFLFEKNKLFHANSDKGKVVSEDFFEYYFKEKNNARFDGVIFFEIN